MIQLSAKIMNAAGNSPRMAGMGTFPRATPGYACATSHTVGRTDCPAQVDPSSTDRRVLGAHFNSFVYQGSE